MTLLGHPAGLFLLFLVEMWERFSYYGMRGLLVLYLVQSAHPHPDATGFINPGRGWSRGDASLLYGWYTGLAYLLPIAGGWIADRVLGTHRSMVVGGVLIALGHLVLAVSGVGSLARTDAGMSVFVFGLALIVIGTGHFKPCVWAGTGASARRPWACSPDSRSIWRSAAVSSTTSDGHRRVARISPCRARSVGSPSPPSSPSSSMRGRSPRSRQSCPGAPRRSC